jgi:hypothetical protein
MYSGILSIQQRKLTKSSTKSFFYYFVERVGLIFDIGKTLRRLEIQLSGNSLSLELVPEVLVGQSMKPKIEDSNKGKQRIII